MFNRIPKSGVVTVDNRDIVGLLRSRDRVIDQLRANPKLVYQGAKGMGRPGSEDVEAFKLALEGTLTSLGVGVKRPPLLTRIDNALRGNFGRDAADLGADAFSGAGGRRTFRQRLKGFANDVAGILPTQSPRPGSVATPLLQDQLQQFMFHGLRFLEDTAAIRKQTNHMARLRTRGPLIVIAALVATVGILTGLSAFGVVGIGIISTGVTVGALTAVGVGTKALYTTLSRRNNHDWLTDSFVQTSHYLSKQLGAIAKDLGYETRYPASSQTPRRIWEVKNMGGRSRVQGRAHATGSGRSDGSSYDQSAGQYTQPPSPAESLSPGPDTSTPGVSGGYEGGGGFSNEGGGSSFGGPS